MQHHQGPSEDNSRNNHEPQPHITADLSAASAKLASVPVVNEPLTNKWHEKVVIIGTGSYATAIGNRLTESDVDTILLGRNNDVANEINSAHTNSLRLAGKALNPEMSATTSQEVAFLDRGCVILAVPSFAIGSVLDGRQLHPDSTIVSMAKGLIIEGWNPLESPTGLKDGPPQDAKVYTPLQLFASHPSSRDVKKIAIASGPGFASDIIDGDMLQLSVGASDEATLNQVSGLFARPGAPTHVWGSYDTIGVEIAAIMKNVIAIVVGMCDGLTEKHGTDIFPRSYKELVKCLGVLEAANLAEHLSQIEATKRGVPVESMLNGRHRTFLGPAGYPDINLSTSDPQGRNYSLGRLLADGRPVDLAVAELGKVIEGAWSAWGIKRLSDDRDGHVGVRMPMTHALIEVFRGGNPSVRIKKFFEQVKSVNAQERQVWVSGQSSSEIQ